MDSTLMLRVALLGIVTGMRTFVPFALLAWLAPPVGWLATLWARAIITLASAGELVGDKLPKTPSRLSPPGLAGRIIFGGLMGWALMAQAHGAIWLGVVLGVAGALAGAFAGNKLRGLLVRQTGKPDLWFALAEDALAIGIGAWAILGLGGALAVALSTFDAIVVGTGQSGPPLAARMAKEGWKVAVIERARFGGTCVNYGCIPTKTMVASARAAHVARRAAEFGVRLAGEVSVDLAAVHARTRAVAGASEAGVEKWMRDAKGVEVILGHARFTGPRRLSVQGAGGVREVGAPKVFIDVGGRPVVPELPGLTGPSAVPFLTNAAMLELTVLPARLVILGGSYIGLEFAQMFRRFGSEVTVIEQSPRLLPREDEDVGAEIQRFLGAEGVQFRVGVAPKQVDRVGAGVQVTLADGLTVPGTQLLVATGRRPNTDDLGLEHAGVKLDARGYIQVDDELRTSAEGVWALGDCNGKGAFTHTSYNDFEIAAANLFGAGGRKVSDRIPIYGMFIDPPLGRVGLNEAQVKARGRPALVAKLPMARVGRARERGETDGFLKAHVDAETKEILGAAFLGIEGDEAVQTLAPVMMAKQPYTLVTRTVMIHPTVNELVPYLFEEFLKPL